MKKLVKRIFTIDILLLIITLLFRNLSIMDELYNYNFARNIINGNILYKDFNAVIFPSFPLILSLLLKVFGEELIVYRIFELFVYIAILFLSFKLLKKLKLSNSIKSYVIISFYTITMSIYTIAEYNLFCLMLVLIILNIEISNKINAKKELFIGLLVGFSITIKQSVGIVLTIVTLFYEFGKSTAIREKIKRFAFKIIGIFIPLLIMFTYLYFSNNIKEWYDLTILGLNKFLVNTYTYFDFCLYGNYIYVLISIIVILLAVVSLIKFIKNRDNIGFILMLYSIPILSVIYPIASEIHVLISLYILVLFIMYELINKKEIEIDQKNINIITKIISIFIVIVFLIVILAIIYSCSFRSYKHYNFVILDKETESKLKEVTAFMKEHENVYFLDNIGVLYLIPNEKFTGYFDLPLVGNFGSSGENKIIDEIKKLENSYIFTRNYNKKIHDQNPKKAISYIEENYEKVGVMNEYNIYYIQN